MKLFSSALMLAGAAILQAAARGMEHVGIENPDYTDVRERIAARFSNATSALISERATPTGVHLNDKTRPFWVDGKAIPEITFDVGESYAGLLPISSDPNEDQKLFFWYFPSTNPKASKEITVYLNGGPGCSSMEGLSQENGPWLWQYGTFRPVKNPWGWHHLTNVIWIDQPVGTGYSVGKPTIKTLEDLAGQFNGFFKNFVETFDLHYSKLYLTGESYAGQYLPHIAKDMLDKDNKKFYDVKGMMLYDPTIDQSSISQQVPAAAFTRFWKGLFPFDKETQNKVDEMDKRCGYTTYLEENLKFPPKGKLPAPPKYSKSCDIFNMIGSASIALNPCWNNYHVATFCPAPWDINGYPGRLSYVPDGANRYFDRADVKKAINAPLSASWRECKGPVFDTKSGKPLDSDDVLAEVVDRLDKTIIGHGLLDYILMSNGTLLTIQNMVWQGQQGFSQEPDQDFFVPYDRIKNFNTATFAGYGVLGRFRTERKLTYVEINLSGHMVPQYTPSASYRHMEFLLGRIDSLGSRVPFTTTKSPADAIPKSKREIESKHEETFLKYRGLTNTEPKLEPREQLGSAIQERSLKHRKLAHEDIAVLLKDF